MIAADRAQLENRLKQLTLQIREKEVTLFTDNFAILSTQAAFLCGLGFSGLTMVPKWQRARAPLPVALLVFYGLAGVSIGFNIMTMAFSSWSMIFGPGLAIRGADGSMSRAVAGMYQERKWALRFFWFGIVHIMLAAVALGWVKFEHDVSISMTFIFMGFLSFLIYYMSRVTRPRFRFPQEYSRKPKAFYVDGLDPETGETMPESDQNKAVVERRKPQAVDLCAPDNIAKSIREINWLLQRGHITPEVATIQRAAAIQKCASITKSHWLKGQPG